MLDATDREAVAHATPDISQTEEGSEACARPVLALPDLEQAKSAVLSSLTSRSGQRTYDHAIREFVAWYSSEPRLAFNRTASSVYAVLASVSTTG
jgi:hypothetical protein